MQTKNSIIVLGNVGGPAKIINFNDDGRKATISIATSTTNGKGEQKTTWHNAVFFGNGVDAIAKAKKGDVLFINGRLDVRKYDNKGVQGVSVEIMVNSFSLLTSESGVKLGQTQNQMSVLGNVGSDPKFHTFPDGGQKASISIATSVRTKSGEDKTTWHTAVFFGKAVDVVAKLKKGDLLQVDGVLDMRKYETQNGSGIATEILVNSFSIIKGEAGKVSDQPAQEATQQPAQNSDSQHWDDTDYLNNQQAQASGSYGSNNQTRHSNHY